MTRLKYRVQKKESFNNLAELTETYFWVEEFIDARAGYRKMFGQPTYKWIPIKERKPCRRGGGYWSPVKFISEQNATAFVDRLLHKIPRNCVISTNVKTY